MTGPAKACEGEPESTRERSRLEGGGGAKRLHRSTQVRRLEGRWSPYVRRAVGLRRCRHATSAKGGFGEDFMSWIGGEYEVLVVGCRRHRAWQRATLHPGRCPGVPPPRATRRTAIMALTKIDAYEVIYSANKFVPRIWLKGGGKYIGQLTFRWRPTTATPGPFSCRHTTLTTWPAALSLCPSKDVLLTLHHYCRKKAAGNRCPGPPAGQVRRREPDEDRRRHVAFTLLRRVSGPECAANSRCPAGS